MNANRIVTYLLFLGIISVSIVLLIDTRAQGQRIKALEQSLADQFSVIIDSDVGLIDTPQEGIYQTTEHSVSWKYEQIVTEDGESRPKWTLHYRPIANEN